MSWLKKFGQIMNTAGGIAASLAGLEPLAKAFLPKTVTENATFQRIDHSLSDIFGAVVTAEVMIGAITTDATKSGTDKLKAATPLVAQIVKTSQTLAGKEVKDQAKFDKAVLDLTSAVADLLNSY